MKIFIILDCIAATVSAASLIGDTSALLYYLDLRGGSICEARVPSPSHLRHAWLLAALALLQRRFAHERRCEDCRCDLAIDDNELFTCHDIFTRDAASCFIADEHRPGIVSTSRPLDKL